MAPACSTVQTTPIPTQTAGVHRWFTVRLACAAVFLGGAFASANAQPAAAADTPPAVQDEARTLAAIRDAAMDSTWTWQELSFLADTIGPRPSGSVALDAAINHVATRMRALGARVSLQTAKVSHWVRGEERAELIDYAGRPDGVTQRLVLTALGGSSATAPGGLEAPVVIVRSLEDLPAHADALRGAIVLFNNRFDQHLAENGLAGAAYQQAGAARFQGPAAAARLGAAAVLVRSVGGADYRVPHTGTTTWKAGQDPIPAAALSAEDADLVLRLAQQGPVRMRLVIGARNLPEVDSANVIADWVGSEHPGEIVLVSGHLDSWDLGTGATDDGSGVIAAGGVIEALSRLGLHPRRTIRFVAWTDEEMGLRGAKAYSAQLDPQASDHCAVIEDDEGPGPSLGIEAAMRKDELGSLDAVRTVLAPIGASVIRHSDNPVGSDIGALEKLGVPGFQPLVDARHYFDLHHTAADTLDKVDPVRLRAHAATMAVLAYHLADQATCPGRLPVGKTGQ